MVVYGYSGTGQIKSRNWFIKFYSAENHDFFSGSGSSYVIGKAMNNEDDWDFYCPAP